MFERASDPRTDLPSRSTRRRVFTWAAGATALLATEGVAAVSAPPASMSAGAAAHQIERQDTVVNKSEVLAQATAPATTSGSGVGAGIGLAELKRLVPARVGAWRRRTLSPVTPGRVPVGGQSVAAKFARAKQEATLTVGDFAGHGNPVPQPWRGAPVERSTESGSEKIYAEGSMTVREEVTRASGLAQVTLILANGIVIGASGIGVDVAQLKKLAQGVDLARAGSLTRSAAPR